MSSEALRHVWLLEGLDDDQLDALSAFTFNKTFRSGELIVEEGHTGNGLYVVVSGEVEVIKGLETDRPQVLNRLGAGDVFGEMAQDGDRTGGGRCRVPGYRPVGVSGSTGKAAPGGDQDAPHLGPEA